MAQAIADVKRVEGVFTAYRLVPGGG
jgi:hypothetical protein